MRTVKKSHKRLLLDMLAVVGGGLIVVLSFVLIDVLKEPGKPLTDTNPGMAMFLQLLALVGIVPFAVGLVDLFIALFTTRGKRVFINGKMLDGLKVLESSYLSTTVEGLQAEILKKLQTGGFEKLADFENAWWRAGRLATEMFYFADITEFYEQETLAESAKKLWRGAAEAREGERLPEAKAVLFLCMEDIADAHLVEILNFKFKLLQEEALCDICLYSLKEKRAFITFTKAVVPGQGITIEKGGIFIENLCAGKNKAELASRRSTAGRMQKPSAPAGGMVAKSNVSPQLLNKPYALSVAFGSIAFCGFFIGLIVWLAAGMKNPMVFFCVFVPVFLLPGLFCVYLAFSTYKKLIIDEKGVRIKRPFGDIEIFAGEIKYAEKFISSILMGSGGAKRVYALYPATVEIENDTVFKANNYKSYVLLKHNSYNKNILGL